MTWAFFLKGANSPKNVMTKEFSRDGRVAISASVRDEFLYENIGKPLLDENGSREFAVDASTGGTPEVIYTDSVTWTGTARTGTWDATSTTFSQEGSQSLDATATANDDEFEFEKATTVSSSSYTALSGYIYITQFSVGSNGVGVRFQLAGVDNGVELRLENYVDESLLNTWQKFIIPLSEFEVSNSLDQFVIRTIRDSKQSPNYYLDAIQLEQSGSKSYKFTPTDGNIFEYDRVEVVAEYDNTLEIPYALVDHSGASSVEQPTNLALDPDKFFGLTPPIGFTGLSFQRRIRGEVRFAGSFRTNADFLRSSFNKIQTFTAPDGSKTLMKLIAEFSGRNRLDSRLHDDFTVTIADDLSDFISLRIQFIGRELVDN